MKYINPKDELMQDLRKLDSEVATRVFGWRWESYGNGGGFWHRREDCKRERGSSSLCICNGHWSLPAFSADPVASKQLREKLAEKWDWILGCGKIRQGEPPYGFGLCQKKQKSTRVAVFEHTAEADTEELAVVLCALKSVGQ